MSAVRTSSSTVASAASSVVIESHAGSYRVEFDEQAFAKLNDRPPEDAHVIVDHRVAELYADELGRVLAGPSVLELEAAEETKSLERFPGYVEHLVAHGVRRDHVLLAIGGGIIQDVTAFLAAVLMRGLAWHFYPTTLLAQADSCIGSKSSINVGRIKNILGTFTPPSEVTIATAVLSTLDEREIRAGIGEILKVHAIEGPASFDRVAQEYSLLLADRSVLTDAIHRSLEIKRRIIEVDEFDRGPRNVMNYGHSFGHAIESATDFAVPHGIAVTMGMDMANHVAAALGRAPAEHFKRMHPTLAANYAGFEDVDVPLDGFLSAIAKDKKNVGATLRLVLPDALGSVRVIEQPNDHAFRAACANYLAHGRR
jgi:3-dehydroquinate synthase